eukprot:COSAG05_NODE_8431_length_704_cov_20.911582_1_plen_50_part_10
MCVAVSVGEAGLRCVATSPRESICATAADNGTVCLFSLPAFDPKQVRTTV